MYVALFANRSKWSDPAIQIHQVVVQLELPESPTNKQIGPFMLTMQLLDREHNALFTTARHVRFICVRYLSFFKVYATI